MLKQLIASGESESLEFKERLPAKNAQFIKTAVAFANGNGGKILFGVQDRTGKIIGIPNKEVLQLQDLVANAIFDACEPKIVPTVYLQNLDGKTVVVADIARGAEPAYCIKSMGIFNGTYIRCGATTRLAEKFQIKTLILRGLNRNFDEEPAEGVSPVSEKEVEKFCRSLTDHARKNSQSRQLKDKVQPIGKSQLLSWKILHEKNGIMLPSNAFCLLSGTFIPSVLSPIQCAVFKGSTRGVFLDRKTYDGPLYNQIEESCDFLLRSLRLGMEIEGAYRQDVYELPLDSVRELICNALCHRNYLEPSHVQVSLFDDRLEVISPGSLLPGLTIEEIRNGRSQIRNQALARVFTYMHLIEGWGSGIPKLFRECREYGLPEPVLSDEGFAFRVQLYRKSIFPEISNSGMEIAEKYLPIDKDGMEMSKDGMEMPKDGMETPKDGMETPKDGMEIPKDGMERSKDSIELSFAYLDIKNTAAGVAIRRHLLRLIESDPGITLTELSKLLSRSRSTIQKQMDYLRHSGIIRHIGPSKSGTWEIIADKKQSSVQQYTVNDL